MPTERLLQFRAGTALFALPMASVSEIREVQSPTPGPGAPPVVAGLAEIRGRVVTLFDLARVFSLDPGPDEGRLAVQFSGPRSHLALLIPGGAHAFGTDPEPGSRWDAALPGEVEHSGFPAPPDAALGCPVLLDETRPAFLLDVEGLLRYCLRAVRGRFRLTG